MGRGPLATPRDCPPPKACPRRSRPPARSMEDLMADFACTPGRLTVCGAKCCGPVPMPAVTWERHKDRACREVTEVVAMTQTISESARMKTVVPLTADATCPFLDAELRCAIYDHRPYLCRQFGTAIYPALECPLQHADGRNLTPKERAQREARVQKTIDRILGAAAG